jgi:hypothetical protein
VCPLYLVRIDSKEGEDTMKRFEYRIAAVLLAVVSGIASMGATGAQDQKTPAVQNRAKSSSPVDAPLLGRIVITPSPEQMAKIRLERRMIGIKIPAAGTRRADTAHNESTGAI